MYKSLRKQCFAPSFHDTDLTSTARTPLTVSQIPQQETFRNKNMNTSAQFEIGKHLLPQERSIDMRLPRHSKTVRNNWCRQLLSPTQTCAYCNANSSRNHTGFSCGNLMFGSYCAFLARRFRNLADVSGALQEVPAVSKWNWAN